MATSLLKSPLNETIDKYLRLTAKELGYEFVSDSSAILWKLDYSHASGVYFDGDLSLYSTRQLLSRIAPDVDNSRVNVSFFRTSDEYFTPERMRVLLEANDTEDTLDDFPVERVAALIQADARSVASRLAQGGYALLGACDPTYQLTKGSTKWRRLPDGSARRRFSCGDVAVEVVVSRTDEFEGYWSGSDRDDHIALTGMIALHKVFAYDLRVRAFIKSGIYFDEVLVFENFASGVWRTNGGFHPLYTVLTLLDGARSAFSSIGKTLVRLGR